jgi:hypothetical protein
MAAKATVDQLLERNKYRCFLSLFGCEADSSRTFAMKPPSMPSVADMMAKSIDPAHIVVGKPWRDRSGSS